MICPKCKKELPNDSAFCKFCGTHIETKKDQQIKMPDKFTYGDIAFIFGLGATVTGTVGLCMSLSCFIIAIVLGIIGIRLSFKLGLHKNKDSKSRASVIMNTIGIVTPIIILAAVGYATLYVGGSLIMELQKIF